MLTACTVLPASSQVGAEVFLGHLCTYRCLKADKTARVLLHSRLLGAAMEAGLSSQLQSSISAWGMMNTSFLPLQEGHSP